MKTIFQTLLALLISVGSFAQKTTSLPRCIAALPAAIQSNYKTIAAVLPNYSSRFTGVVGQYSTEQIFTLSKEIWTSSTGQAVDNNGLVYAKAYFDQVIKTGNTAVDFKLNTTLSTDLKAVLSSLLQNVPDPVDAFTIDNYLYGYASKMSVNKLSLADNEKLGNFIAAYYANYEMLVTTLATKNPSTATAGKFCWSCFVKGIKCGLAMIGGASIGGLTGSAYGTVTLPIIGTIAGATLGMIGGAATALAGCI